MLTPTPRFTPTQRAERNILIRDLLAAGITGASVARRLGITPGAFYVWCGREGIDVQRAGAPKPTMRYQRRADPAPERPRLEPRLCQRPAVGGYTSTTARLMGDPKPGRTPWSGEARSSRG